MLPEKRRVIGFPVGLRIEAVRMLSDAEMQAAGWTCDAVALELSDGTVIYATSDYGSSEPGTLCGMLVTGEQFVVG